MGKYYSVIARYEKAGPWSVQFGDYDKRVAREEAEFVLQDALQVRVICTGDTQEEIDAEVARLNGAEMSGLKVQEELYKGYRLKLVREDGGYTAFIEHREALHGLPTADFVPLEILVDMLLVMGRNPGAFCGYIAPTLPDGAGRR